MLRDAEGAEASTSFALASLKGAEMVGHIQAINARARLGTVSSYLEVRASSLESRALLSRALSCVERRLRICQSKRQRMPSASPRALRRHLKGYSADPTPRAPLPALAPPGLQTLNHVCMTLRMFGTSAYAIFDGRAAALKARAENEECRASSALRSPQRPRKKSSSC